MRIERVVETGLYVGDVERSAAWYEDVLGLTRVSADPPRHVFLAAGDTMLLLFDASETSSPGEAPPGHEDEVRYGAPHGASGVQHVALGVDDVEAWRERLEQKGVEVQLEAEWPGGGRSLYFDDPDGHSIELVGRGTWPVW